MRATSSGVYVNRDGESQYFNTGDELEEAGGWRRPNVLADVLKQAVADRKQVYSDAVVYKENPFLLAHPVQRPDEQTTDSTYWQRLFTTYNEQGNRKNLDAILRQQVEALAGGFGHGVMTSPKNAEALRGTLRKPLVFTLEQHAMFKDVVCHAKFPNAEFSFDGTEDCFTLRCSYLGCESTLHVLAEDCLNRSEIACTLQKILKRAMERYVELEFKHPDIIDDSVDDSEDNE